jgi:FkbM family methyltransferase
MESEGIEPSRCLVPHGISSGTYSERPRTGNILFIYRSNKLLTGVASRFRECGLDFHIHPRPGDRWDRFIVREVVAQDCYRLKQLPNLRTILDIGAHIGSFSVLASTLFPAARIVAYEPNPTSMKLLRRNALRVTAVQEAVGHSGTVWLKQRLDNTGASVCINEQQPNLLPVASSCITDVLDRHRINTLDLLKLDCEGYEIMIVDELVRSGMLKQVRFISGEWHHNHGRLLAMLEPTHLIETNGNLWHHCGIFHARLKTPIY